MRCQVWVQAGESLFVAVLRREVKEPHLHIISSSQLGLHPEFCSGFPSVFAFFLGGNFVLSRPPIGIPLKFEGPLALDGGKGTERTRT